MTSTPEARDPDWPRYPETILSFFTKPPVEIDLRETPSKHSLAQLAMAGFGEPFAVVTASDPRGENLAPPENEGRNGELRRRLEKSGYRFARVDARSPDGAHCESSAAVAMPQGDAIALAKELEQVAIFWFDGSRFWILGGIVEMDPMMLPGSS